MSDSAKENDGLDSDFEEFESSEGYNTEDPDYQDTEDLDRVLDANGKYVVHVETQYGSVHIEKEALDQSDPTWMELLDTYLEGLKALGYSFSKKKVRAYLKNPF